MTAQLHALSVSHAAWEIRAVPGMHAMHTVNNLGTAGTCRCLATVEFADNLCCGLNLRVRPLGQERAVMFAAASAPGNLGA